jgi:hypothetical protein
VQELDTLQVRGAPRWPSRRATLQPVSNTSHVEYVSPAPHAASGARIFWSDGAPRAPQPPEAVREQVGALPPRRRGTDRGKTLQAIASKPTSLRAAATLRHLEGLPRGSSGAGPAAAAAAAAGLAPVHSGSSLRKKASSRKVSGRCVVKVDGDHRSQQKIWQKVPACAARDPPRRPAPMLPCKVATPWAMAPFPCRPELHPALHHPWQENDTAAHG